MMVLYRLQMRLLATRARLLALGSLGLLGVLLALFVRSASDRADTAFKFISSYGLAGLIPICSLVLASASLGDLAEDATLVHVWLRPVPRRSIAIASWLASVSLVVPLAVLPLTAAALACGVSTRFAVGTLVAALLGTLAYTALFVGFGLRVQRALTWGLAYVLIWEGAIANTGSGLSRVAVRGYTRSVLRSFTPGEPAMKYVISRPVSLLVLTVTVVLGLGYTVRRLGRTDIA